jgi:Lon protease-like protein
MVAPAAETGTAGLPDAVPVFPLTGALLLPAGDLPLNIFEPRYLAMVDWALAHDRWLAMVQPRDADQQTVSNTHPLFAIACLGRITKFAETGDGRYLITVSGRIRFRIAGELPLESGFRRVTPDYGEFMDDLDEVELDREARRRLMAALAAYFEHLGYQADWPALEATPDRALVAAMAMACPFEPAEKQALLEARDLAGRAQALTTILEMAASDAAVPDPSQRH